MNRIVKRVIAAFAIAGLIVPMAACSAYAQPDQIILYYNDGVGETKTFSHCVEPSKKGDLPMDDLMFALPTSLRTWNIREQGGDTDQAIKSGTKPMPEVRNADGVVVSPGQPGPEVKVYANAEFYLNTNCGVPDPDQDGEAKDANSAVVQFWEKVGRRYAVSSDGESSFEDEGWKTMLLNTLVPAEEKAIREATRDFLADDLDANLNQSWATMQQRMGPLFQSELRAKLGGDFFCGPEYQRGRDVTWKEPDPDPAKPVGTMIEKSGPCPPIRISITDVQFADPEVAKARASAYVADQNGRAAERKAQSDKAVADLSKDPNVMRLKEMENERAIAEFCTRQGSNCTLIQGVGGQVNVNAGK